MEDDRSTSPRPEEPTETSPLLGSNGPSGSGVLNGHGATPVAEDSRGAGDDVENGPADNREGGEDIPKVNMYKVFPPMCIGVFLVAMDQTLTLSTYAKIGNDLVALNSTSWIATAYYLTLTIFQPLYGKLSDIFGRKECLLFSYSVFGIGCLGCGLSGDIVQLCIWRAIAGIGGGGMNSVVSILLTDLVSLRDRGLWQGYLNIIFAAGLATGAPLGGLLADTIGWRWSFIGQAPLSLIAVLAVYFALVLPRKDHSHWSEKLARIDFLGAFALGIAVTVLLFGLDNGSNEGWGRLTTIVTLSLTPALFAVFILVEMKVASNPFAPGHVILDRSLFAAYLANFAGVAGQLGLVFCIALFFQAVDGCSASQAGALLIPGTISGVSASLFGGYWVRRTGRYKWVTVFSYGLFLFSIVPLVMFTGAVRNSTIGVVCGLVLVSLAQGSGITTTLVALISNAAKEDMAVVIACSYLFRSLGSSVGVSISSAVLQQVLRTELAERLNSGSQAREIEERVRQSLDYIKELKPETAEIVRKCYAVATTSAVAPVAVLFILAFVSSWFIRDKKLNK